MTISSGDPLDLLQQGAMALGLTLPPPVLDQFARYLAELKRWNARINLTALRDDRDIIIKHFLDSLAVIRFLGPVATLADLGSGAGFPGVVLKLIRPEMALTLIESRGKKAAFLEYLAAALKLKYVEVIQASLTPALARGWGPRYNAVISRATFLLPRFLELAAPLLQPGGTLLALKGPRLSPEEIDAGQSLCASLGLGPLEVWDYLLPLGGEARRVVRAERK